MKLRDFRVGLRLLLREPGYSAVVVFGLAVGFAVCFLLLGLVRHSLSYDRHVPDGEHTYYVKTKRNFFPTPQWVERTPLVLRDVLARSGQPVTVASVLPLPVSARVGDQVREMEVLAVDPEFERMFGARTLAGSLGATLVRPDAMALTGEAAQKLFGDPDALGKRLTINGTAYEITAILANPPVTTTLPYGALVGPVTSVIPAADRQALFSNWGRAGGRVYFNTGGKTNGEAVAQFLQDAVDRSPLIGELPEGARDMLNGQKAMDVRVGALRDAYFDTDLGDGAFGGRHGNRQVTLGLSAVAILILVLAATNYVNLATVRTIRRQREIGVRKVLGSGVGGLVRLFLAEAVAVSLLATVIGLLLAWSLSGIFADLVNRPLQGLFDPVVLAACLLLGGLVGVLAGAYPVWIALGVRANTALAGRGSSESRFGLWLRRGLTVLQFSTAIGLTAVSLAIALQTRYASSMDPGFDPAPLLVFDLPNKADPSNVKALYDELARATGIAGVTTSSHAVGRDHYQTLTGAMAPGGTPFPVDLKGVSHSFFDTYGIRPLAGRLFNEKMDNEAQSEVVVLNTAAALALGFSSPQEAVGKSMARPDQSPLRIIGVAPDIRFQTARDPVLPAIYYADPDRSVMTVRASSDLDTAYRAVETAWRQYFPNDALTINRANSFFANNYVEDQRLSKILIFAAITAVLISAFGIYVLSAYNVQRLSRQIVIRKLYGAGHAAIARLIAREFLMLVVVSGAIGLPLAALAIQRYMSSFTERAPGAFSTLAFAMAATALVAVLASLRHAWSATNMPPALVMRLRS